MRFRGVIVPLTTGFLIETQNVLGVRLLVQLHLEALVNVGQSVLAQKNRRKSNDSTLARDFDPVESTVRQT
jgi:hypothetical protein